MGSKRFETTRDLTHHGVSLLAVCQDCKHQGELTADQLDRHAKRLRPGFFGPPRELRTLARHLRCSKCGSFNVAWGPQSR